MTSSIELTTHQDPLSLPVDIHTHLVSLVPCLASVSDDRVSAWIYAPAGVPAKLKNDVVHAVLALHLDSETRTDASLIVKLPFTSAEAVGRPNFGPTALKLGALTNRAPSKNTADKLEACRQTYRWMCLKAEKLGRSCSLWMPFEPVYGELTAEEKEEMDDKDKQRAVKVKEQQKVANTNQLFFELMPASIHP